MMGEEELRRAYEAAYRAVPYDGMAVGQRAHAAGLRAVAEMAASSARAVEHNDNGPHVVRLRAERDAAAARADQAEACELDERARAEKAEAEVARLQRLNGMAARFWSKAVVGGPNDCWPWRVHSGARNYPKFWLDGQTRVVATRLAWEFANGREMPPTLDACHTCDNARCVNPAHIWPGTPSDNAKDAVGKGRVKPPCNAGIRQKEKTRCKSGHPFDTENTIVRSNGQRGCKACQLRHGRKYDRKTREAARRAREALAGKGAGHG